MNLLKKIQTFVNQSDLNFWIVIGASAGLFVVVLVTCFYCLSFRRRRRRRCSARKNKHLSVKDDHHTFYECREPSSRLATEITITDNYNQDDVSTIGEPSVFVVGYDDNMNAVRVGQCNGSEQQQQQQQHHTMFLTKQQQSSRGVLPKNVRSSRHVQSSSSSSPRVEGYSHYPANFLNEPRSAGPQKKYAEIEVTTTTTTDRPAAAAAAAQNVSSLSGIVSEKRQGDKNHHDHHHHANNNGLGHESVWNGKNNHPVHTRESLIFAVDHDDEEAPSEPEYYGESAQTPESSSVLLFTYDDDDDDNSDDDEEPSYQNQQRRRSHHASLVFGGSGMQTMTTTTRDLSTFTYDEDVSDDDAVYHDEELAFSQPAAF